MNLVASRLRFFAWPAVVCFPKVAWTRPFLVGFRGAPAAEVELVPAGLLPICAPVVPTTRSFAVSYHQKLCCLGSSVCFQEAKRLSALEARHCVLQ